MPGGRRLPPSMERLWLGELRRAHAIIHIISITPHLGRRSIEAAGIPSDASTAARLSRSAREAEAVARSLRPGSTVS
jgi:hypothetical protein